MKHDYKYAEGIALLRDILCVGSDSQVPLSLGKHRSNTILWKKKDAIPEQEYKKAVEIAIIRADIVRGAATMLSEIDIETIGKELGFRKKALQSLLDDPQAQMVIRQGVALKRSVEALPEERKGVFSNIKISVKEIASITGAAPSTVFVDRYRGGSADKIAYQEIVAYAILYNKVLFAEIKALGVD